MARFILSSSALVGLLALSACSFTPKYERPQMPVSAQYPQAEAAGNGQVAAVDLGWREFFTDQRLQALIALALENNRDLRLATQRIEEARAQYGVVSSDRLPTIGVMAAEQATRYPEAARPAGPGSPSVSRSFQAGVGISSFELDFWGRVKNLSEAAYQQYLATEQAQRTAHLTVVAMTAESYFRLRAAQEMQKLMRHTLKSRTESLRLVQTSYDNGVASSLDLNQAKVQYSTVLSDMAAAERSEKQAENALRLMLGTEIPDDMPAAADFTRAQLLPHLPVGLPSELLERRPDIIAAEMQLKAANANIGAARAAFFPNVTLTGLLGFLSPQLGGLFSSDNRYWQFQPQIVMPLFSGGTRGRLQVAEAQRDMAVTQYEKTIQTAFREVADSLAGEATYSGQIDALSDVEKAASETVRLANLRYEVGVDSFLQVQTAEISLYGTRQAYIQTGLASLLNRVELYKALGGGWNADTITPQDDKA
ncbi:efflux transporter outer membrane subunit [Alcaligenes endophyticus]|uniref:Efflux transporter outer membrane subunit n=1 Tax=Alcaligenes endophyticus TaxID=1929088 RepID=A0ABT8EJ80_9BURK|nr:efflux transporter outer membrane subunit [Alcaligenes endophyticus]MCX5591670.1 efflux transporter outer membrane subunit [Alcaligenes endophyticus]MDN4121347.1 efflux transporter outer membrane subunit [Alcaligenes endophyticus]